MNAHLAGANREPAPNIRAGSAVCTRWPRAGLVLAGALATLLLTYAVTDPSEPNDDAAHATPLAVGVSRGHSILPAGDQDWYKFSLTGTSKVIVNAFYTQSDQFEAVLLDFYHDLGGGTLDNIRVDEFDSFGAICSPGDYYVKVTEFGGLPLDSYDLGLSVLSAAPDRYEPDDLKGLATALSFGAPQTGHTLAPESDVDWYAFTVPGGGANVVLEAAIPSGGSSSAWGRTHIRVFDSYDFEVAGSDEDSRVFLNLAPGNYTARVEAAPGSDISAVYAVRLWDQNAPDPFENDDSPAHATWLPTDSAMQTHNFYPAGDQDWYQFYANAGETVSIEFPNTFANANPVVAFFEADGVTPIDTGGSNAFNFVNAGFYFVRVTNDPSITTTTDTVYTIGAPRQPPGILPGALAGTVTSAAKGAAIPNATISLGFGSLAAQTDGSGVFVFPALPPDTYQVTVSADGYQTALAVVGIGSGSTLQDFQLDPVPQNPADINNDSGVNAVDVQLVINKALGIDIGALDADVNHDSQVNAVDVQSVINAALAR